MEPPNKDLIATSNGAKVHRPYLLQSVMYVTQAAIVNCNYHFYTTGPSALYVFGENRTAREKTPIIIIITIINKTKIANH
jgi:hypothetical protein